MIKNLKFKTENSVEPKKACLVSVHGDVQGVSYRYFARTMAENLSLSGWAKNEDDGSVTILAQGSIESINKMIEWCRTGSPMATVESVSSEDTQVIEGLKGFEIK